MCGPHFFREILTAECYQELNMQCISLLDKIEWEWQVQKDDAAAHMVNSTMAMISEFFDYHVILIYDHQDHWT